MDVIDKPLAVEIEIEREKAAALGRTGRKLRTAVERLRELESAWTGAPETLLQFRDYCRAVKRAHRCRYHLIVQREAVGLKTHGDVDRLFPIPCL